jgi:hypothetical protein
MAGSRFLAAVLAAALVCSIVVSGCTGQPGMSQPPASTVTIPTRRPTTPVPVTQTPIQTGMTTILVTQSVTPVWTPGTVTQAGSAILIQGDVTGLRSERGNFIDAIQFTVVKAPRAEPVTFEIPNTQIILTEYGEQFGTNYQILSGDVNGNHILGDGERFVVQVPIPAPHEIYAGQKFTMAIQNPPQPQVIVTAGAPPILTGSMVLASAAP